MKCFNLKMKDKLLLIAFSLIITACATNVDSYDSITSEEPTISSSFDDSSIEESSINTIETLQETKVKLLNELNSTTVDEVNKKAIELGLYKPMYENVSYYNARFVYPFNSNIVDTNNYIFLNKFITNNDKNALLAKNYHTQDEAIKFLEELGYKTKNEITIPYYDIYTINEQLSFLKLNSFLYHFLYKEDLQQDLVESLTRSKEVVTVFTLKLKTGIYWKDYEGNIIKELTSDDVIDSGYQSGFFRSVGKYDNHTITLMTKENTSIEEVKAELIRNYNQPLYKDNRDTYNTEGVNISKKENGYVIKFGDKTITLYNKDSKDIDYDFVYPQEEDDNAIRSPSGNTYGYVLNRKNGNEAYQKALDNVHFRKALLALFSYNDKELMEKLGDYTNTPSYKTEAINYTLNSLSPVNVEAGIDEAKKQCRLAKLEGQSFDDIELYLGNFLREREASLILQKYLDEVFEGKVKITLVSVPEYYYSRNPYLYREYDFVIKLDFYRTQALSQFEDAKLIEYVLNIN